MRGRRREKSGRSGGIYDFHLFFPPGTIISRRRCGQNLKHGVAAAVNEGAGAQPNDTVEGLVLALATG